MKTLGKTLISIGLILFVFGLYLYSTHKNPGITITKQDIKETNFTGTKAVITGERLVVEEANKYVSKRISEFKVMADKDVPDIRARFGADSASSNYTLDINAEYLKGPTTESIVVDEYAYTGGANGNGAYKVFTASIKDNKLLTLADMIKSEKQTAFTTLLKKKLNDWRPEGSTDPVVFPEEVNNLKFASLSNWSMDKDSLIIYFDKYAIGPGVLGEVAFPIPLSDIKDFLK